MSYIFFIVFMPIICGIFPLVCGLIYLLSLAFGFAFTYELSFIVWLALVLSTIALLIIRNRVLKKRLYK